MIPKSHNCRLMPPRKGQYPLLPPVLFHKAISLAKGITVKGKMRELVLGWAHAPWPVLGYTLYVYHLVYPAQWHSVFVLLSSFYKGGNRSSREWSIGPKVKGYQLVKVRLPHSQPWLVPTPRLLSGQLLLTRIHFLMELRANCFINNMIVNNFSQTLGSRYLNMGRPRELWKYRKGGGEVHGVGSHQPSSLVSNQNIPGHLPCWMQERTQSNKQLKMDFAINAFLISAFCAVQK